MATVIGTWDVTVETPMGSQVVALEFSDEHAGIARFGSDSVALSNVTVSGNSATCAVKMTSPIALTLTCAVTVDGDAMTGTAGAGFFGRFALTGRRRDVAKR